MKPNIYDLCPCGSGKKIKFCCGIKKVTEGFAKYQNYFTKFLAENSSKELLKTVAFLQLIPENATKLVRLEEITHSIISNFNKLDNRIHYQTFNNILDVEFSEDYREDPAEGCFSEIIMFKNGNSIVFPGLCNNSTETNQILIEALYKNENNISKECLNEIENGILFNLTIHNYIAKRLKISRYEHKDDYKGKIHFPDYLTNEKLDIFVFPESGITRICEALKLPGNTIDSFSVLLKDIPQVKNPDDSILLKKPFVKIDDEYILVLPSSQMYSLNYFINNKITIYNQNDELKKAFENIIKYKTSLFFYAMGWKNLDLEDDSDEFQVWQFDSNKIAIVDFSISRKNVENTKKIKEILKEKDGFSTMYITIVASLDVLTPSFSYQENMNFIDYQLMLSFHDLERLMNLYNLKDLDLWNYLFAQKRAIKKGLQILPHYSILSYYSWYEKNGKSFFPSDDHPVQLLAFGLEIQGNKVIESLQKNDRHLVLDKINNSWVYSPVTKTRKLFPIYTSDRIFNGILEQVLERYEVPLWVKAVKADSYGNSFTDCIMYWLNEFSPTLKDFLKSNISFPITFIIDFDPDFFDLTENELNNEYANPDDVIIRSEIDFESNIVEIVIPKNLFFYLNQNNNIGEIILMKKILNCLSEILNISGISLSSENISLIISTYMPIGMKKMIVTGNSIHDISKDNRYIDKTIKLDKASTSIVLEDMVSWMKIKIPVNVTNDEKKKEICRIGINTLIDKIRTELKNYNSIQLLKFLMERHESIINSNSFYRLRLVTYHECYGKYEDVFKEFMDEDSSIIRTGLCLRSLIEFATAEVYYGNKIINNSDIDFLIALIDEVLFLGATVDLIESKIGNPKIGLLPSGRLGVSKESFDKMNKFSLEFKKDELTEYSEMYNNPNRSSDNLSDAYFDRIDNIFKQEYGIEFYLALKLFNELAHICIEDYKTSCLILSKKTFIRLLEEKTNLSLSEIDSFLNHFTLTSRGNIGKPPKGYNYSDIFPWRYNRKLSYLLRPIILIKNENEEDTIIFSPRHLNSAYGNLHYALLNGILKVDSQYKKINSFLADRNNIKGKEFRNEVANWLQENPNLEVIPYEYKIPRKGQIKDYGDIDILVFDKKKKIIYCIECKNTKQTKTIYEFSVNIQNYIEKQLPKHFNRIQWVKENKQILSQRFNYDFTSFNVKSFLVSSFQLPLKLIENVKNVEIYSLNELKRKSNIF